LKKIVYISILIFILGCKQKSTKEVSYPETRYYPTDRKFIVETSKFIELDNTRLNFKQITNEISSFQEKVDRKAIIRFEDNEIKKLIIPYVYDIGLIKQKNVLKIKSDSILIDNGYPISELNRILKRHYLNKGKIARYSTSPRRALVEITIDTNKTGKDLEKVLTKLTQSFDEIKKEISDTIELRVLFDYRL